MALPLVSSPPGEVARYQVFHDTRYRYAAPVSLSQQLLHLWPRDCPWQRCLARELLIEPLPTRRSDGVDVFGNPLTRLAFKRPHDELRVDARLQVEVLPRLPLSLLASPVSDTTTRRRPCRSARLVGCSLPCFGISRSGAAVPA